MGVKIIKGGAPGWRPFLFPPRPSALVAELEAAAAANSSAALQKAISDGYQEGLERGYQEGLEQGRQEGRSQAFEQGLQQGLPQGLEGGRREGRQEFEQLARRLEQVIESFEEFRRHYERARREELLELVRKVSQQVIRCELTLHPAQLLTLAEEALATMPGDQEDVRILLNPEEYARIKDVAAERAANWRLVPDERLPLGECRVVTAHAEADIGCQQRLDSCMETLKEHLLTEEA